MVLLLGTAGVWRKEAIKDAGGWKDRTTVEDMDLAVRASLKGWKFVYAGDVRVRIPNPTMIMPVYNYTIAHPTFSDQR